MVKFLKTLFRPIYRRSYMSRKIKLHMSARIFFAERAKIGEYVYIGPNCMLNAEGGLWIGDGTILAPEVVILTTSHDFRNSKLLPYDIYDQHRPVEIGRGVWIGYRAMIVPGVRIGDGAVIAMGAVVATDVEPGSVVAGNPALKVGSRNPLEIVNRVEGDRYFHEKYWSGPRVRKVTNKI